MGSSPITTTMDFEEKLIRDIGEEVRTIYAAIVYAFDNKHSIVYLDILKEDKNCIDCTGFNLSMFEKMDIEIGSKIWVESFKQPNKMIVKVKPVSVEELEIFPETSFLELYRENRIPRPTTASPFDVFNL